MSLSRKADMQRELDELRGKSQQVQFGPIAQMPASQQDFTNDAETVNLMSPASINDVSSVSQAATPAYGRPSTAFDSSQMQVQGTIARSLDGVFVESFKIDDCFSLYDSDTRLQLLLVTITILQVLQRLPCHATNLGLNLGSEYLL